MSDLDQASVHFRQGWKAGSAYAQTRIKELESALVLYGAHGEDCDFSSEIHCTCGLWAVIAPVKDEDDCCRIGASEGGVQDE